MSVSYVIKSSSFYSDFHLWDLYEPSGCGCFSVNTQCGVINHKWLKVTIKTTSLTFSVNQTTTAKAKRCALSNLGMMFSRQ